MKITTYQQLDELVAKELGYCKYEWEEECSQFTTGATWVNGGEYYAVNCHTWIPAEVYNRTDEEWKFGYNKPNLEKTELDYYRDLEEYLDCSYFCSPRFSTNVFLNEELVNYIISDPLLSISTWLTKKSSWAAIYHFDKRWVGYCGEDMNLINSIDSPINSLPLAICLAFLKYKGIEVKLEIDE